MAPPIPRPAPALALLGALAVAAAACDPPRRAFRCRDSAQCAAPGAAGLCQPSGFCSFPDPACPAGQRYSEHAAAGRALRCVETRACGDGVVDPGEDCDDGNHADGDGCTSRCVRCGPGDGDAVLAWSRNGTCYSRHDRPLDWQAAWNACADRGGHLVGFGSVHEQREIEAALASTRRGPSWVGLADLLAEGTFVWMTGEPLVRGNERWLPGRPDDRDGRHDCVSSGPPHAPAPLDLSWEDEDCARPLPYVCERPPWVVRPATGHVYRALYRTLRWDAAQQACRAIGAQLVTITDADEQAFVATSFFGSHWIGASDRLREGDFRWVTGEPFVYRAFAPTEPDNYDRNHHCLVIAEDDLWHDRPCGEGYRAVCEAP